ncbi:MAG: DNA repair protein RecO, partial [Eubacteriales bacterium]|nr:DNA repair protein RecO [Eubacteriales bacterium]
EAIRSFYAIGEDIDKYMYASYALEFTDKLLEEDKASPRFFELLIEYFDLMSERKKDYDTLLLAFQVKSLFLMGVMPILDSCAICGCDADPVAFSVPDGGAICAECRNNLPEDVNVSLIFNLNFGIVNILKFFVKNPLRSLEKITLEESIRNPLIRIIREYCKYHMDIGNLKSEIFLK